MLLGIWAILAIFFTVAGFSAVCFIGFLDSSQDPLVQPGEEHLPTQIPGLVVPVEHH